MAKRSRSNSSETQQNSPKARRVERPPPAPRSPTAKTQLVKIDILTKNGAKLNEDLPIDTLIELWASLETEAAAEGCSSHRKAGGAIRAYFYLNKAISLSEIHPEPEFNYNRSTPLTTDSFQCRIADCNGIRRPKKEEIITVCITRTHFGVPLDVIEMWTEKFGKIITKPRY